jgi:hypothetical protein
MPFATIFRIKIELGNDAMNSPEDVARALRKIADRLEREQWEITNPIRDENGNTVGSMQYGRELV